MTQDFAKIRPEPLLERKTVSAPSSLSFLLSGVAVGIAIGIFGCVLLYLSGNVPPLNATPAVAADNALTRAPLPADQAANSVAAAETATPAAAPELTIEFYDALSDYVVEVSDEQVQLTDAQLAALAPAEQRFETGYLLQSGAFQQRALAESELARQQAMGLDAFISQETLPGRLLFLVQSGPYLSSTQLAKAERLLRSNNISSLRLIVD